MAKAKHKPTKRKSHEPQVKPALVQPSYEEYYKGHLAPTSAPPPTAAETLTIRQSTHGDFSENARVMQQTKRVLRSGANWMGDLRIGSTAINGLYAAALSDVQAEAIEMIVVKLGRIVTGDPNHADSWLDIEGYARLARERLV